LRVGRRAPGFFDGITGLTVGPIDPADDRIPRSRVPTRPPRSTTPRAIAPQPIGQVLTAPPDRNSPTTIARGRPARPTRVTRSLRMRPARPTR